MKHFLSTNARNTQPYVYEGAGKYTHDFKRLLVAAQNDNALVGNGVSHVTSNYRLERTEKNKEFKNDCAN